MISNSTYSSYNLNPEFIPKGTNQKPSINYVTIYQMEKKANSLDYSEVKLIPWQVQFQE